jgi:hypothetical protein
LKLRLRAVTLLALIPALAPAASYAQNTSFATSVHLLVGQSPVRVTLATGSADRFYDAPVVANRSYCAEATASETEVGDADPVLALYRADTTTPLGQESGHLEPKGATASRVCFIAPATETIFVKLSPETPAFENREYSLRLVETTLWTDWFFVGGDYSSYTLLRNTTSGPVSVDIRWRSVAGGQAGALLGQLIVPNGVFFVDARTAMSCPFPAACPAVAGSVEVAHAASPEAIVGSQTTLSVGTGLSFDAIFFQRRPW